jgi:hypothetical protein
MKIGACLLTIILMVGCSGRDKIPSGIIPRDKMEKILWDMMEADQYASIYLVKDSSARANEKMETLKLYKTVFQLNKVSRDEFRESYQFYLGRPDLTRSIFDSLLSRGNRLRMESYRMPQPVATVPPVMPTVPTPQTVPSAPVRNPGTPVFRPGSNPVPPGRGAGKPAPGSSKRPVPVVP